MDKVSVGLPVIDVYSLASQISEDFGRLVDYYGPDVVANVMYKVVNALEHLEAYARNYEKIESSLTDLQSRIAQLEYEKYQNKTATHRLEEELEQTEENWKKETSQLKERLQKLEDENRRLSNSLAERESLCQESNENELREEDIAQIEKMKHESERHKEQILSKQKEILQKQDDLDSLQQQLEHLVHLNGELRPKLKHYQTQSQILLEEKADVQAELKNKEREMNELKEQLNVALKQKNELERTEGASAIDLQGKLIIDLNDPNRPRFTLDELKNILFERNNLKARVSELEDELAIYHPKTRQPAPCDTEEAPVQGPINQEPDEKLFPNKKVSVIRKLVNRRNYLV